MNLFSGCGLFGRSFEDDGYNTVLVELVALKKLKRSVLHVLTLSKLALPRSTVRFGDVARKHVLQVNVDRNLLAIWFNVAIVRFFVAVSFKDLAPRFDGVLRCGRRPTISSTVQSRLPPMPVVIVCKGHTVISC